MTCETVAEATRVPGLVELDAFGSRTPRSTVYELSNILARNGSLAVDVVATHGANGWAPKNALVFADGTTSPPRLRPASAEGPRGLKQTSRSRCREAIVSRVSGDEGSPSRAVKTVVRSLGRSAVSVPLLSPRLGRPRCDSTVAATSLGGEI